MSSSVTAVPALAGTWQSLPAAPIASGSDTRVASVWTGREMFVFARAELTSPFSVNAAAAYNPTSGTWRKLAPPPGLEGNYEGTYAGVWTGKEVLVVGPTVRHAFNPVTNHWRRLSSAGSGGLVVWTGREMIGWGGGCCGDASATGTAYNPARHIWRTLARAPLGASQQPVGAWTGRELIVLVSGIDPQGKRYPASLARAAAYNPKTNTWRRIAPLPVPLAGAKAVWDGHELLVVGAGTKGRTTFVYRPATNRWLLRAPMPRRVDGRVIWTTNRLMLWTGRGGLAYNPNTNRWSVLPQWPFAKHDTCRVGVDRARAARLERRRRRTATCRGSGVHADASLGAKLTHAPAGSCTPRGCMLRISNVRWRTNPHSPERSSPPN